MYKIISLLFIFIFSTSILFGQRHRKEITPEMRAKFEAQKISYITQQLDISPEQAQVFWPLYNDMKKKKDAFHEEFRQLMRQLRRGAEKLNEKELATISDRIAELKVEKAIMQRTYHYEFKKVLSAKQIVGFHVADKDFQGMLLRRIKGEGGRHKQRN